MNEREYINAVLDELRAKMEENRNIQNAPHDVDYYSYLEGVDKCLETIDEYRKEQK